METTGLQSTRQTLCLKGLSTTNRRYIDRIVIRSHFAHSDYQTQNDHSPFPVTPTKKKQARLHWTFSVPALSAVRLHLRQPSVNLHHCKSPPPTSTNRTTPYCQLHVAMDIIDAEQVRNLSLFRPLGKQPVTVASARMCCFAVRRFSMPIYAPL